MQTVARVTILLKAKFAATSVEMEIIHAENAMLVGHNNWKKVILGFIVSSRRVSTILLLTTTNSEYPARRSSF